MAQNVLDKLLILIGFKTDAKKASTEVESSLKGIENTVGKLTKLLKIGGLALLAKQAAGAVFNLAKLGAQTKIVREKFTTMVEREGKDAVEFLKELREASANTLSDLQLFQKANTAQLLGLGTDRLTDLMKVARGAAQATGETVDFMFNSIVTGLGRQSKLMLDNLGIIVTAEEANEKYAKSLGKTVSQLTDAERKQAFMNDSLDKGMANLKRMGGLSESNADKIAQMGAAWENMKASIGELLATPVAEGLSAIAKGINKIADALSREEFKVELEIIKAADVVATERAIKILKEFRENIAEIKRFRYLGGGFKSPLETVAREVVDTYVKKFLIIDIDLYDKKALDKSIERLETEILPRYKKTWESAKQDLEAENEAIKEAEKQKLKRDEALKDAAELLAQAKDEIFQRTATALQKEMQLVDQLREQYNKLKDDLPAKQRTELLQRINLLERAIFVDVRPARKGTFDLFPDQFTSKIKGLNLEFKESAEELEDIIPLWDKLLNGLKKNPDVAVSVIDAFANLEGSLFDLDESAESVFRSLTSIAKGIVSGNWLQAGLGVVTGIIGLFTGKSKKAEEEARKAAERQARAQQELARRTRESTQALERFTDQLSDQGRGKLESDLETFKALRQRLESEFDAGARGEIEKLTGIKITSADIRERKKALRRLQESQIELYDAMRLPDTGFRKDIIIAQIEAAIGSYENALESGGLKLFETLIENIEKQLGIFGKIGEDFASQMQRLQQSFEIFDIETPVEQIEQMIELLRSIGEEIPDFDLRTTGGLDAFKAWIQEIFTMPQLLKKLTPSEITSLALQLKNLRESAFDSTVFGGRAESVRAVIQSITEDTARAMVGELHTQTRLLNLIAQINSAGFGRLTGAGTGNPFDQVLDQLRASGL